MSAKYVGDLSWRDLAGCKGLPDRIFFDINSEADLRRAKSICRECPVRSECLDYAIRKPEPYGVWGGLNEKERDFLSVKVAYRQPSRYSVTYKPTIGESQ